MQSLLLVLLLSAAPAVTLTLQDGTEREGRDLVRKGDVYRLETYEGEIETIPIEMVAGVRLQQHNEPAPEPEAPAEPEETPPAAIEEAPLDANEPQQLAGSPWIPTPPSEQREVLGEPAAFRRGVVDPHFRPESDYDPTPNEGWAPSRWSRGVVDPTWTPTPAFPLASGFEPRPVRWPRGPIDSTWVPEDGFETSVSRGIRPPGEGLNDDAP